MILPPDVDGRRVQSFVRLLRTCAAQYTPDLDLSDDRQPGAALLRIFAQLAETVAVRLDRAPQKHFVAFLDALGVVPTPARAARAPLTFKLTGGLATTVDVPEGTRVTAQGAADEIPFETTHALVAIPGALQALYSVDPASDKVFGPPPGFLTQKPRIRTALVYQAASFAAAGSDRLQLDHVTDLVSGSFLRIDCREQQVVRKVDAGNIVTLERPLAADVEPGTVVVPIQDFEVFNGIDVQEHVLYIGHSRVLTVKSELLIRLAVDLQQAAASPLDLAWEFWTKDEAAVPPQDEHWAPLGVVSDRTNGFTRGGEVVLRKPGALEVKPREIDQRESRWIRARVVGPLRRGVALPEIDAILVGVETPVENDKPKGMPADQGFFNATPLAVQVEGNVGFFPFGSEPRLFDQFYVASKEAFSKPGAAVTLTFTLDVQMLATPAAVLVGAAGTPVGYAIGHLRRLYEIDASTGAWTILGDPSKVLIAGAATTTSYVPVADAVPSVVADDNGDTTMIFVTAEDLLDEARQTRVFVLVRPKTGNAHWVDLGAPQPPASSARRIKDHPAAVRLTDGSGFARVFVVAGDGDLYSQIVPAQPIAPGLWQWHGNPGGELVPGFTAVREPATQQVLIYATASNGDDRSLHQLRLSSGVWTALAGNVQPASRPLAVPYADAGVAQAKVFVNGAAAPDDPVHLFEIDSASNVDWSDLGAPAGVTIEADPAGTLDDAAANPDAEGKHIFVRGSDKRLHQRLDDFWQETAWPGGSIESTDVTGSPAAIAMPPVAGRSRLLLLTASTRNSMLGWVVETISDDVPADADGLAALLSRDTAPGDHKDRLIRVVQGGTVIETRTIAAYDERERLALLSAAVDPPIAPPLSCRIGTETLPVRGDSANVLRWTDPSDDGLAATLVSVHVDGHLKQADFYSRPTGLLAITDISAAVPNKPYVLQTVLSMIATEFRPPEETDVVPDLSWEYWDGRGWLSMPRTTDLTNSLLKNGDVRFAEMPRVEPTEVAGQQNFWIRVRLVGGDYGREVFRVVKDNGVDVVKSDKSSLHPPKVRELTISYTAAPVPLEACQTFNTLDYRDQTAAAQLDGAHFPPFQPIAEDSRSIFLGFERPFKTGPVRVLLDAAERDVDPRALPAYRWQFRKDHEWRDLQADDESQALTRQGLLTLSAPDELTGETLFGRHLYWIRGSLRTDRGSSHVTYPNPLLRGVFPNTAWASQGETATDEIVGSSDGEPRQRHPLQHRNVLRELNRNVLREEDIRVREPISAEERDAIVARDGAGAIVDRSDIGGAWVRWKEVRAFFDAGPDDRVYAVDRAAGIVRFGDGVHGAIPPADVDNIRAFRYRFGGGAAGNVGPGEIKTLATAIQGIEAVFNPTAAGGGSDTATTETMLQAGPEQISHRDRAVTPEDFEALAREATRQVAKARCLAATQLVRATSQSDPCHPAQRHEAREARGWVSLIIVPRSNDPLPCSSLELRRTVLDYLRERAPSLLAAGDRLVVRPPDYVVVTVRATLVVRSLESAAAVERAADDALRTLLHPLNGGPEGQGWEFGRPLAASDVFAVLERIADLDHVEQLRFGAGDREYESGVEIEPNQLIAGGRHALAITAIGT